MTVQEIMAGPMPWQNRITGYYNGSLKSSDSLYLGTAGVELGTRLGSDVTASGKTAANSIVCCPARRYDPSSCWQTLNSLKIMYHKRQPVSSMHACRGWWMPTARTYTAEGDDLCSCSIFTVPVLNAKKSHRPLHGLRRDASDPERRRWQIVPVRPAGCAKKKVISAASFSAARRSEVFAPKASANSIYASGENVNTNRAAARKARSWPPSREATRLTPSWALTRGSGARKTSSPYREAIDSFDGVDDVTPAAQHT